MAEPRGTSDEQRGTADGKPASSERAVDVAERGLAGAFAAASRRRRREGLLDKEAMDRDLAKVKRRIDRRLKEGSSRPKDDDVTVRPAADAPFAIDEDILLPGPADSPLVFPDTKLPEIDAEELLAKALGWPTPTPEVPQAGRRRPIRRLSHNIGIAPPLTPGEPVDLVMFLRKTPGMAAGTKAGRDEILASMVGHLAPSLTLDGARNQVRVLGPRFPIQVHLNSSEFDKRPQASIFSFLITQEKFDELALVIPVDPALRALFDAHFAPPMPEKEKEEVWESAWRPLIRSKGEAGVQDRMAYLMEELPRAIQSYRQNRTALVPGHTYPSGMMFLKYGRTHDEQIWISQDLTPFKVSVHELMLDSFREGVLKAAGGVLLAYAIVGAAVTVATVGGSLFQLAGALRSAGSIKAGAAQLVRLILQNPRALALDASIDVGFLYATGEVRSAKDLLRYFSSVEGIIDLVLTILPHAGVNAKGLLGKRLDDTAKALPPIKPTAVVAPAGGAKPKLDAGDVLPPQQIKPSKKPAPSGEATDFTTGTKERTGARADVGRATNPKQRGVDADSAAGARSARENRGTQRVADDDAKKTSDKGKTETSKKGRGGGEDAGHTPPKDWRKIDLDDIPPEVKDGYYAGWLSYRRNKLKNQDDYVRYRYAFDQGWVKNKRYLPPKIKPGGHFPGVKGKRAERLGQVLGAPMTQTGGKATGEAAEIIKRLRKHWEAAAKTARREVDLDAVLAIVDDKSRRDGVRALFNNWRSRWYTQLKNDPVLKKMLKRAGVHIRANGAPAIRYIDPDGKPHWLTLNLDHIDRIADNPRLALDINNLRLVTPRENSAVLEGLRRGLWEQEKRVSQSQRGFPGNPSEDVDLDELFQAWTDFD